MTRGIRNYIHVRDTMVPTYMYMIIITMSGSVIRFFIVARLFPLCTNSLLLHDLWVQSSCNSCVLCGENLGTRLDKMISLK